MRLGAIIFTTTVAFATIALSQVPGAGAKDWIDLIQQNPHDPGSAFKGSWYREGKAIVSEKQYSILPLQVSPSGLGMEYDVLIQVSQGEKWGPFGLCFQAEQGFGSMEFNHQYKQYLSGIQKINGVMIHEAGGVSVKMEPDNIYTFRLEVRKDSLAFYQGDSELLKQYAISPTDRLTHLWHWDHRVPREGLALASELGPTSFHRVAWRTGF